MEGIRVSVAGSQIPPGTTIAMNTQALGSVPPPGTNTPGNVPNPLYFDVSVQGISQGTATVSITNNAVKPDSPMKYWDRGGWMDVTGRSVQGKTISGDIPVSALRGTPIVIGT